VVEHGVREGGLAPEVPIQAAVVEADGVAEPTHGHRVEPVDREEFDGPRQDAVPGRPPDVSIIWRNVGFHAA